jgi:hypothetical protein
MTTTTPVVAAPMLVTVPSRAFSSIQLTTPILGMLSSPVSSTNMYTTTLQNLQMIFRRKTNVVAFS